MSDFGNVPAESKVTCLDTKLSGLRNVEGGRNGKVPKSMPEAKSRGCGMQKFVPMGACDIETDESFKTTFATDYSASPSFVNGRSLRSADCLMWTFDVDLSRAPFVSCFSL